MDWLRRTGRTATPDPAQETSPGAVERSTPGVAALLDGVKEDRTHAILDLGEATESSFSVYSRFARRIRFADLLAGAGSSGVCTAALRAVPPQPERPYDLLFAWDLLDRIFPEERPRLVQRLAELSSADARLHVMTESSGKPTTQPMRFSLVGVDRIRYEPTGPARPARPELLPAEVERLLAPFEVVRAFTLKVGLREYVAVRRKA